MGSSAARRWCCGCCRCKPPVSSDFPDHVNAPAIQSEARRGKYDRRIWPRESTYPNRRIIHLTRCFSQRLRPSACSGTVFIASILLQEASSLSTTTCTTMNSKITSLCLRLHQKRTSVPRETTSAERQLLIPHQSSQFRASSSYLFRMSRVRHEP